MRDVVKGTCPHCPQEAYYDYTFFIKNCQGQSYRCPACKMPSYWPLLKNHSKIYYTRATKTAPKKIPYTSFQDPDTRPPPTLPEPESKRLSKPTLPKGQLT